MNTSKPNLDQLRRLKELFGVGDGNSGDELSPSQFVQALEIARTSIPNTATAGTKIITAATSSTSNNQDKQEIKQLFRRIDANSDESIDWNEYTNYLLLEEQGAQNLEIEESRCEITSQNFVEPRLNAGHHHREIIHTIIKLDKKQAYLTASGDGEIKLWELNNLAFRRTVDHQQRITCVIYMPRPAKLVVGSVDRTLTFYEMTSFNPIGKFCNLHSVPQTLTTFDEGLAYGRNSSNLDVLLWGDDGGELHGLRIHPFRTFHVSNFEINCSNEAVRDAHKQAEKKAAGWHPMGHEEITMTRSSKHLIVPLGHGVDHIFTVKLHDDWITKVEYIPPLDIVVTASLDGTLRFFDLERRLVLRTCVAPERKAVHDFIYCPGTTTKFIASSR